MKSVLLIKPIFIYFFLVFLFYVFLKQALLEEVFYEGIAAVVGSDIITNTDIEKAFIKEYNNKHTLNSNGVNETRRKVLDKLIEEKVIDQQVDKLGIEATQKDIDASIDDIKRRVGLTRSELEEAIAQDGISMEEYKQTIKHQIEHNRLINREMVADGLFNEDDLKAYYNTHKSDFLEKPKVHLRQIIIHTHKEMSEKELEEKARLILSIKERVLQGEDFSQLAKQFSDDKTRNKGGDIGYFSQGELMSEIEKDVFSSSVNSVVGPFRSGLGYHLIKIDDKKEEVYTPFKQVKDKIREQLIVQTHKKRWEEWLENTKKSMYIAIR